MQLQWQHLYRIACMLLIQIPATEFWQDPRSNKCPRPLGITHLMLRECSLFRMSSWTCRLIHWLILKFEALGAISKRQWVILYKPSTFLQPSAKFSNLNLLYCSTDYFWEDMSIHIAHGAVLDSLGVDGFYRTVLYTNYTQSKTDCLSFCHSRLLKYADDIVVDNSYSKCSDQRVLIMDLS